MSTYSQRDLLTQVSERSLRLLLVAAEVDRMIADVRAWPAFAQQWRVSACASVAEALRLLSDGEPDLVVLGLSRRDREAGTPGVDLQDAASLLEHAKLTWPRTVFMLYTQTGELDPAALVETYGEMLVLESPGIRELCQRIEEQAAAMSVGLLRGLSLPGLLQMMQWEHKSAAILVQVGTTWGRLHLRAGELVDAYVHASGDTGEQAALTILSWQKVTLFLERSYHNQHHIITRPLTNLLMDAMKQRDDLDRNALDADESQEDDPSGVGAVSAANDSTADLLILEDSPDAASDVPEEDMFFKRSPKPPPALPPARPPNTPPVPLDFALAPLPTPSLPSEVYNMENVKNILESALNTIDGAMAVALVDYSSGMALGTLGSGVNLDIAAAGNTEVVRAKLRTMESLGIQGSIEDILITLDGQYHIIYLVPNKSLFMYLVLSKDRANLAMARYKLKALTSDLRI
ncbi:DUF4388 domain-containing protein [Deinococcus sp.]|uniref:DUF4388 domain-containing protein n=1 Tax=Deinococcus sp. TaxID=47478 RepID=UPI003CC6A36D